MTPKEKAIELFNKMDMIIYTDQDNWKHQCKSCAIVGVKEILNIGRFVGKENAKRNGYANETTKEFWEEVILEIQLL